MKLTFDELIELLRTSDSFRVVTAETIIRLMTDELPLQATPSCAEFTDLDDFMGK